MTTYGALLRACETAAVLCLGSQLVLKCGNGRCDPALALPLYAARYIQRIRAHPGASAHLQGSPIHALPTSPGGLVARSHGLEYGHANFPMKETSVDGDRLPLTTFTFSRVGVAQVEGLPGRAMWLYR
jgi:hypothetical protein